MNISIDGKRIKARNGETILDVASRMGIFIPTLCHDEKLEPYSSCFLCAVKVKGSAHLKPSCSTVVTDGMKITTGDEEILATRRLCLELLLSHHCGECLPPCRLACPAGCDARGYINLILAGRYDEALRLIMETVPLPATIGRICPHPCEDECRRYIVDEPVSICALKRFAADRCSPDKLPRKKRSTGKRVAIIGSGPAGLSAAYFLSLEGHKATIFETRGKPGGMLRYGIPEYRLPKDVLDREIETITRLGVRIECGISVGKGNAIPELLSRGFNAVLIAVGAQLNRRMGIDGEELDGVFDGIDFLAGVASGKQPQLGRTVFVVGGGNTATDAARTALRLGAKDVSIVYRRSREEMPASAAEVMATEEEGVDLRFLTLPVKIARSNGRLEVTCSRMALGEPDASGRRKPIPIPGSEYQAACDSVIMAIGQIVDTSVLKGSGLEPTPKGRIGAGDDTLETTREGVFSAGDCVTGPDIAISAIAAGRRAAYSIDTYMRTGRASTLPALFSPARRRKEEIEPSEYADVEKMERVSAPVMPVKERVPGFSEVENVFEEDAALREAHRCLDCGCEEINDCEIRDLSNICNVAINRFGSPRKQYTVDDRHPHIERDPDKCIKCARCIRVCLDVQGIGALGYVGRGFDMQVAPPFGLPLQDTDCESCGQCITACPTGALTEKPVLPRALSVLAEKTDTTCAQCGAGCRITVHTSGFRICKVTPKNNSNLCEKGKFKFGYLTDERRIIFPMAKRGKRLARVNWPEAAEMFREGIRGITGKRIAVFISARSTNEEAYTAQRLARTAMKTNNIYPSSGRHFSKRFYTRLTPFISPHNIEDIAVSDAIVLVNPAAVTHNEVAALPIIRAVRNGAPLLILGSKKTKLDRFAWKKLPLNPDQPEAYLNEIKSLIRPARKPIIVYNRDCVAGAAIISLHTFAKKNSVRLVSLTTEINEQGLLDAGVSPYLLPGQIPVRNRAARKKLEKKWKGGIPAWQGMEYREVITEMERGGIEVVVFLGSHHDKGRELRNALRGVKFVAVQALIPSPLTRIAGVVIPAASWVETKGTLTRYDGKILRLRQALPPLCGYSNLEIWELLQRTSD